MDTYLITSTVGPVPKVYAIFYIVKTGPADMVPVNVTLGVLDIVVYILVEATVPAIKVIVTKPFTVQPVKSRVIVVAGPPKAVEVQVVGKESVTDI